MFRTPPGREPTTLGRVHEPILGPPQRSSGGAAHGMVPAFPATLGLQLGSDLMSQSADVGVACELLERTQPAAEGSGTAGLLRREQTLELRQRAQRDRLVAVLERRAQKFEIFLGPSGDGDVGIDGAGRLVGPDGAMDRA